MRTGLEPPTLQLPELDELENQMRHVGADLTSALTQLPTVDQVAVLDQMLVRDIRWNIAEALRLGVSYRRRLCDRLAGSTTPAQGSSPQSLHDPPPHVTPGTPEKEEPPTP